MRWLVFVLALGCAPAAVVKPPAPPVVRCGLGPPPVWQGVTVVPQPDGSALIAPEDARTLQRNIRELRQWAAQAAACGVRDRGT